VFRDQDRPAKASVILKLRRRTLAEGEPDAIRNLVSSAVDGCLRKTLSLLTRAGTCRWDQKALSNAIDREQALEAKLISTLEPVTGPGNVRASVTLDYERSATDVTQETYDPDKTVTLSMQRTEQTAGAQPLPAGVPAPPPTHPTPRRCPSTPAEHAASGGKDRVRYLWRLQDRSPRGRGPGARPAAHCGHCRQRPVGAGCQQRKAAVWQPRSADEVRNLTALAQASVGFDSTRGDMLTVEDLAFDQNRSEQPAPAIDKWMSTAENSPVLVKYLALFAGLLILLAFGVRPALRQAGSARIEKKSAKPGVPELSAATATAAPAALKPPPEPVEVDPERLRTQEIFEQVTEHLKREPTQSSSCSRVGFIRLASGKDLRLGRAGKIQTDRYGITRRRICPGCARLRSCWSPGRGAGQRILRALPEWTCRGSPRSWPTCGASPRR